MYALDFEFDGQYLSDYGFIVCDFYNSNGYKVASAGSNITFCKVSVQSGKKNALTNTRYDECLHAAFCIIKNPSIYGKDNMQITNDEYRDLMRWLNRRVFLKFRFFNGDDYDGETCYFMGSFNISKIKIDDILYGLELSIETDAPFGYGQEQIHIWEVSDITKQYILSDISDEMGITYPSLTIEIKEDGDFLLCNAYGDDAHWKCNTMIKNCKAGEIITIDGVTKEICSSLDTHDILNDFNYECFMIENSKSTRRNRITCSLPCKIKLSYTPIIKNGLE